MNAVLTFLALAGTHIGSEAYVGNELLVCSKSANPKNVTAAISGIGKFMKKESTGFYRVKLLPGIGVDRARKRLLGKGFGYVYTSDCAWVNPNSLKSVRNYIAYKRAAAKLFNLTGEEVGVDFYEALEFYLEPRVDQNGYLDHEAYAQAVRHREQMPHGRIVGKGGIRMTQITPMATWQFQGPQGLDVPYRQYYGVPTISGRKNDVQYAPSNPTIMYTASAGGGIWKSTNSGTTWSPTSDTWKFLHSSTVAVAPNNANLVLAGTGDYVGFFTAQTFGIMRSTDGGATWTNVGVAQFGDKIVSKIVFDPLNPSIVVATAGRGSTIGDVYRSTDGGVTWANTATTNGSWEDIDVAGVDIVMGSRRIWACGGGTGGTKIAYSDDHGVTWTAVAKPPLFNATEQTMDIAASRNDPDGVYVVGPVSNTVYKSNDGGVTWVNITAGLAGDWSQSTYDNHITCGNNAGTDVVYVGLISIHATDDGGTTWADIAVTATASSKWHNDQHCMAMHPTTQNEGFAGGDGGLARLVYAPATNTATMTTVNTSFGDVQFYGMALHPSDFTHVMGGTQDNASPASRGALATWDNLWAGDGGFCGFNRTTPGIHYTTSQGGGVYRYDTALDTSPTSISPGAAVFVTPLDMGNTSYTDAFTSTGSKLQRYNGAAWTASTTTLASNAQRVVVSKRNGQRIFTCHSNGNIYMSKDNGVTLGLIDGNLPNISVGSVAESPFTNFDVIAVLKTTSGTSGRVFRCTNVDVMTPTWTNISGAGATALPNMPVNAVAWDPYNANIIYVGTDVGVFMTTNGGTSWANLNTAGLPNVHVNDLVVSNGNGFLYAATFGRGIWRISLSP